MRQWVRGFLCGAAFFGTVLVWLAIEDTVHINRLMHELDKSWAIEDKARSRELRMLKDCRCISVSQLPDWDNGR